MISTSSTGTSVCLSPYEKPAELVEQQAERRVAAYGSYAHCFKDVVIRTQDGVLTLTGRVPTFYLKQLLQTWLKNLDGVTRIDNQVEVVNSRGLSSVRAK